MNRPSSALGLLLGFLALTMFAVSSTSRSTTVKPAASFADRAAVRRQAALSRMSALAAAAENTPAGDSFDGKALCVPGSIDATGQESASILAAGGPEALQTLHGAARSRLMPTSIESIRDNQLALAVLDGRACYDDLCEDIVLGATPAMVQGIVDDSQEKTRELSASEITTVFQSIIQEKSAGSRNATRKSQRRASLNGPRFLANTVVPTL